MLSEKLLSSSGNAAPAANYIEDVFSTYVYTGNGTSQTIVNGIDLSTKGGMVWTKNRDSTYPHRVMDTVRGMNYQLDTAVADAQFSSYSYSANTNGYNIPSADAAYNRSGNTYVSWTFAKQPKFFDVVTYTGDGVSGRAIPHNLGSVPGCIIVKATSTTSNWAVYHRGLTANQYTVYLNSTAAENYTNEFPSAPTSTDFYVRSSTNGNGVTFVAYVFAHDAGGFGLTGTDNVISCGSFTADGSGNATVSLGYEPQYLLWKASSTSDNWYVTDTMRGWSMTGYNYLIPNTSAADATISTPYYIPTATGFKFQNSGLIPGATYIYIAIRRGPMKVPTDATKVFIPIARTGTGTNTTITTGFVTDSVWSNTRTGFNYKAVFDRLRGAGNIILLSRNSAETNQADSLTGFDSNTGIKVGTDYSFGGINYGTNLESTYGFQRSPSFFDEICYKGTGTVIAHNHNLTVVPELVIAKNRSAGSPYVYCAYVPTDPTKTYSSTDSDSAFISYPVTAWALTSTTFQSALNFDLSGNDYVVWLYATCPGVSKVGGYTGTGTLTTINCGFTGGARFVMIKRTDSTSDWFVWDTARGMVAGTDPAKFLNLSSAESNANSVYTIATGFQLLASPAVDVNTNGGSYIYLAIA